MVVAATLYIMNMSLPTELVVSGDADWAGAEDTRSTQCTVAMFGGHCREVCTSSQGYVATASTISELLCKA